MIGVGTEVETPDGRGKVVFLMEEWRWDGWARHPYYETSFVVEGEGGKRKAWLKRSVTLTEKK